MEMQQFSAQVSRIGSARIGSGVAGQQQAGTSSPISRLAHLARSFFAQGTGGVRSFGWLLVIHLFLAHKRASQYSGARRASSRMHLRIGPRALATAAIWTHSSRLPGQFDSSINYRLSSEGSPGASSLAIFASFVRHSMRPAGRPLARSFAATAAAVGPASLSETN